MFSSQEFSKTGALYLMKYDPECLICLKTVHSFASKYFLISKGYQVHEQTECNTVTRSMQELKSEFLRNAKWGIQKKTFSED